jgi:hypothetical protein
VKIVYGRSVIRHFFGNGKLALIRTMLPLGDGTVEIDMHTHSMMVSLLGAALAVAGIACDAGNPGSCTMTQTLGADTATICEEVPASLSGRLRATCNSSSVN